jgi:two-component sensor histidine kinase
MRTETAAGPGANLIYAVARGPEETPSHISRHRLILWICVLGWTAFAGLTLLWLGKGNGGDLVLPGFNENVQSMFRGELGLRRTCPWILFSPYLALIAWHFPLERERLRRNLTLNAAACLAFLWACYALALWTHEPRARYSPSETSASATERSPGRFAGSDGAIVFRGPSPGRPPRSPKMSLRATVLDLLAYGAVTGLVHSVNFHRRLRERERRALFLESNLANARLKALKAQLQPHFLFNSLNAIVALLRRDPRLAETTLVALSELLRLALSQSERQEGALREELEFVQRYLKIQQTRFADKLRVEQDIESQALECMVPTLVLQPLVENAIRHGIEPAEKAGVVRVSASRKDGKLVLAVEDNGVGLASAALLAKTGTGIGLANLRERLQALYGAQQRVELPPRATGGVTVRVEIPWRLRTSSGPADLVEA